MTAPEDRPRLARILPVSVLALTAVVYGGVKLAQDERATRLATAHAAPPVDHSIRARREEGPGGQRALYNTEAVIPPQCYTRTEGTHNPCYVCHQNPIEGDGHENRIADGWLQGEYGFTDFALTNRWSNLTVDRTAEVAAISDEEIRAYIAADNYAVLRARMAEDASFRGWKPDLEGLGQGREAFDADGIARDGSAWVAFNYMPMPSTFWPTNGSTDDVMIRLPEAFRGTSTAPYVRDVYLANLSILEAAIKNLSTISTPVLDEARVGTDLDGDGKLRRITRIARPERFVGAAENVAAQTFLYPAGTEFLHTVRYVGVTERGEIVPTPRMKEVRYMVKHSFSSKPALAGLYDNEVQEKIEGTPPYYADFREQGLDNGFGWRVQGYIEDSEGALRPNAYEETLYCMGCHTTVGSTIDHTFAFGRKVDGRAGWGYIDLHGMPDAPSFGETEGQILTYLRRVGGGSEFRNNDEMASRFFLPSGAVNEDAVRGLDVYGLITPSPERALLLDKAYLVIVRAQSYLRGRDATVTPPRNVFALVDADVVPLAPERRFAWDIRIAWPEARR